ncbi:carbohydrate kinase family protein [Umezawaea tangerina]|nr:PfkB family carbohydrate kinase [Umezawaea tangerina]
MTDPRVFVAGPVSWNRLVELEELPEARPHKASARRHWETIGGTSAGKALNLARLGARVTLRTAVGDDDHGRRIVDTLAAAGVEVIAEIADGPTEQHLNLMDSHGGRVSIYLEVPVLTAPRHDDRALAALADADAVVIDLAEHSRPLLAATSGLPVWCDLHDYDGSSAYHQDFLDAADYLFLNDDGVPDRADLAALLASAGCRVAVATLGADGAMAVADGVHHRVAAVPVERVVDTNGAGDAFFAGFLLAHLAGADVPAALTAAATSAAHCLGSPNLA